jgi:hypothetical protein
VSRNVNGIFWNGSTLPSPLLFCDHLQRQNGALAKIWLICQDRWCHALPKRMWKWLFTHIMQLSGFLEERTETNLRVLWWVGMGQDESSYMWLTFPASTKWGHTQDFHQLVRIWGTKGKKGWGLKLSTNTKVRAFPETISYLEWECRSGREPSGTVQTRTPFCEWLNDRQRAML